MFTGKPVITLSENFYSLESVTSSVILIGQQIMLHDHLPFGQGEFAFSAHSLLGLFQGILGNHIRGHLSGGEIRGSQ
jgi:hypothetical protein